MAIDYFFSRKPHKNKDGKGDISSSPILSSPKEPRRRSSYTIDYGRLTWVIIAFAVALLAWWFFVSQVFIVKNIIYEQEPSAPIKERIESLYGKNIFLLKLDSLSAQWQMEQPIIKTLTIYRGLPNTLRVRVEERSKALVWGSGNNYYLLDSTGVAYEDAGTNLRENYLPIIDDSKVPVDLGSQIVSTEFISAVKEIVDNLPDKISNESIKEIHVGESTFGVVVITSENIKIKFDVIQPIDLQLEAVDFIYKEKRSDVHDYIDVRVLGKAYIK